MRALFSIKGASLFILFLVLTACSSEKKPTIKPKVFDEAGILKKKTIFSIENNFVFPPDIPLYIRTVKELPPSQIAIAANDMMENENYWKEIRPKSWYKTKIEADPSYGTGIYILISENPRLLQVRYGPQIRMEAYRAGIAAGQDYMHLQEKYIAGNKDKTLLEAVKWLEDSMPRALLLPWYLKISKNVIAYCANEFDDFLLPSDGIYTNWLFKPYLYLSSKGLIITNKAWIVSLITALLYWSIRIIVVTWLLGLILNQFDSYIANAIKTIFIMVISVFLAFPALGCIMILSSGRLEDGIAMSQLGINISRIVSVSPVMFTIETSAVIALIAALLRAININLNKASFYFLSNLPNEHQVKCYEYMTENNPATILLHAAASSSDFVTSADLEKRPFTELRRYFFGESAKSAAKWFAFLLFMPKGISLYALAMFALPLPLGFLALRTAQKDYSQIKDAINGAKD